MDRVECGDGGRRKELGSSDRINCCRYLGIRKRNPETYQKKNRTKNVRDATEGGWQILGYEPGEKSKEKRKNLWTYEAYGGQSDTNVKHQRGGKCGIGRARHPGVTWGFSEGGGGA